MHYSTIKFTIVYFQSFKCESPLLSGNFGAVYKASGARYCSRRQQQPRTLHFSHRCCGCSLLWSDTSNPSGFSRGRWNKETEDLLLPCKQLQGYVFRKFKGKIHPKRDILLLSFRLNADGKVRQSFVFHKKTFWQIHRKTVLRNSKVDGDFYTYKT